MFKSGLELGIPFLNLQKLQILSFPRRTNVDLIHKPNLSDHNICCLHKTLLSNPVLMGPLVYNGITLVWKI